MKKTKQQKKNNKQTETTDCMFLSCHVRVSE